MSALSQLFSKLTDELCRDLEEAARGNTAQRWPGREVKGYDLCVRHSSLVLTLYEEYLQF